MHTCRLRTGHCLEQVIPVVPIPWGPLPDPFTLAGDEQWTDYEVSTEVEIPLAGVGTLFGRIDSADVFRDGRAMYPSGYGLLLKSNGEWRLVSTATGEARWNWHMVKSIKSRGSGTACNFALRAIRLPRS